MANFKPMTKEQVAQLAEIKAKHDSLLADRAKRQPEIEAAKAERATREAARPVIAKAIQDAQEANVQKVRSIGTALKDLAANPTGHVPVQVQFEDLTVLIALQAALHDYTTPFPPEHLKQAWADLQARRLAKE
jgi:hypothetical protein